MSQTVSKVDEYDKLIRSAGEFDETSVVILKRLLAHRRMLAVAILNHQNGESLLGCAYENRNQQIKNLLAL